MESRKRLKGFLPSANSSKPSRVFRVCTVFLQSISLSFLAKFYSWSPSFHFPFLYCITSIFTQFPASGPFSLCCFSPSWKGQISLRKHQWQPSPLITLESGARLFAFHSKFFFVPVHFFFQLIVPFTIKIFITSEKLQKFIINTNL